MPIGDGPSSLGILTNVWTVLAGSQTAASPAVATTAVPDTTAFPTQSGTASADSSSQNQTSTRAPAHHVGSSSDDDDFFSFQTGRSSFVVVDYTPDQSFAEHFETVHSHDLTGQTTRVARPHRHNGVQMSIKLYLAQYLSTTHNVTRILWAGRQVRFRPPANHPS